MFVSKARVYPSVELFRLLALPTNITLGWEGLPGTNNCLAHSFVAKKIMFCEYRPCISNDLLLASNIHGCMHLQFGLQNWSQPGILLLQQSPASYRLCQCHINILQHNKLDGFILVECLKGKLLVLHMQLGSARCSTLVSIFLSYLQRLQ